MYFIYIKTCSYLQKMICCLRNLTSVYINQHKEGLPGAVAYRQLIVSCKTSESKIEVQIYAIFV